MLDAYIREYGPRVFGLALKLCRSREDAEDLYQETWLKACRFLDRYDPSKAFGAWITSICVNTYRDSLRRQKWRSLLAPFSTTEDKDRALANHPAEEAPDYGYVRDAVNALPEKYRLVVILHYFNDLDIKKTSEALSLPEGTVKYNLYRAREILKGRLSDE